MAKSKKNIRNLIAMTLVATTVIFSSLPASMASASTRNIQNKELADSIENGVILHAWNWSFNTIKDNLDAIADAGYTSIQVSPIQGTKENTKKTSYWWLLYQPTNFSIGNAQLGTREEFKQLCDAAEAKGIKIIVDVVANHTANAGGGNDQYYPSKSVDPDLLNDPNCWHDHTQVSDWNNRWQVTHYCIGLPDLNSSNAKVQNKVISYLNDCIDCGADGFRFDAAKHIELPSDSNGASDFWSNVLGSMKKKVFVYGEVLQGGADNFNSYTNYMDVLASNYGDNVRSAVGYSGSKNVYSAKDYSANGVGASHLVTEVETHDTYANNNFNGTSSSMNDWQIKMGWALIAARADSVPLFFDRPTSTTGDMGAAGNTNWKDKDVISVNKFHNLMAGENEYIRPQSNYVTMIERGTKGAVIVNLDGATTINSTTNLADGTYTNHASTGGTFTVSSGKISGNLPAGITVLYNEDKPNTVVSSSKEDCDFTDSLTLTLGAKNVTSATYSIDGGAETAYKDGQIITIGKDTKVGDSVTLKLKGTNGTSINEKSYTYRKVPVPTGSKVYFYNTNNWSNPYVYVYSGSTGNKIAAWPGVAMTKGNDGLYSYQIPKGFGDAKVIFSDKGNNQYPASGQEGLAITDGASMEYKNGTWQIYDEIDTKPTVSISKEDCSFTDSLTLTLGVKNATSSTYSIGGVAETAYKDGQTITIGKDAKVGDKITLELKATNGTNTAKKSYTYTKEAVPTGSKVYFYNTNNWSNPYVYVYSKSTGNKIAAWPGAAMTKVSDGLYSYTIPEGFGDAKVIFSDKGNNQYPGSGQEGLTITSGSSMVFKNGSWDSYK
ncbi:starch-binding protein [Clostridium sp. C2-6-12]|uniref:starch-binding protein n=1 Tax=Clostridium sp. C2-6-12 TaxID=2698832 RepID=UPI0013686E5F|nr:starch-binding protein [Clostridium sp. C2-6-12]